MYPVYVQAHTLPPCVRFNHAATSMLIRSAGQACEVLYTHQPLRSGHTDRYSMSTPTIFYVRLAETGFVLTGGTRKTLYNRLYVKIRVKLIDY